VQFGTKEDAYNFQLRLIMSYQVYGSLEPYSGDPQPKNSGVVNYFVDIGKSDILFPVPTIQP